MTTTMYAGNLVAAVFSYSSSYSATASSSSRRRWLSNTSSITNTTVCSPSCCCFSSPSLSIKSKYSCYLCRYNTNNNKYRHRCCLSVGSQLVIEEEEEYEEDKKSISPTPQQQQQQQRRRQLILLRHADSSWQDRSLRDHDRPLSKAGRVDAVEVSHKLQQLGWVPQLILSSDAVRTKETLQIMQDQVKGFLDAEVHFLSSFYSIAAMDGQTADHLRNVICKFSSDEILIVMCMGHNRGWEEAASVFSGKPIELKTCNAALLETAGETWEEAFSLAGFGGWKLQGLVRPYSSLNSV